MYVSMRFSGQTGPQLTQKPEALGVGGQNRIISDLRSKTGCYVSPEPTTTTIENCAFSLKKQYFQVQFG